MTGAPLAAARHIPRGTPLSLLDRVEGLLEGIFEGSFRRLFRPRLHPPEIARRLERTMLEARVVGTDWVEVPNVYVARLSQADYDAFAGSRSSVEHEISAYLTRRAEEERLRPIAPIRVTLVRDQSIPRSAVRGEARFEDPEEESPSLESTRRLEVLVSPVRGPQLVLRGERGEQLRIGRTPIRIGRAPDNDLVVPDPRVSRYHAWLQPGDGECHLRDLDSTNGTLVDGVRVGHQTKVRPPAVLSLGGYRISLRSE